MIEYDDNITIQGEATGDETLKDDEWYVLMVKDEIRRNDPRSFFDPSRQWLGLERTGDKIYISKDHWSRLAGYRGDTLVVSVNDADLCCILSV